ncbi:ComEA family DNA-binding protein [Patescibacteria group bacterium]|nr:ComEA family DNA-binding protein [Patescibacteria group bacterium]MBU1472390.1 ComEA family DNA-binding protein [Patescibacteria group bacterium]MBU2459873.1 ComEA family DNA-binding protein [Patescibacteria group bacterium]
MDESPAQIPTVSSLEQLWSTYKAPIILGSVSLLSIVIAVVLLVKSAQTDIPIEFSSDREDATVAGQTARQVTVDIEGAVVRPGVYRMPEGSRIEDAIVAAGGLSKEADHEQISQAINRAALLIDGGKLYIPKKGAGNNSSSSNQSSPGSAAKLVNVNSASQSDLEALSGIGPVTAQKIINGRPYQTLEELVTRKAIGQSLFEKLKSQLIL